MTRPACITIEQDIMTPSLEDSSPPTPRAMKPDLISTPTPAITPFLLMIPQDWISAARAEEAGLEEAVDLEEEAVEEGEEEGVAEAVTAVDLENLAVADLAVEDIEVGIITLAAIVEGV